MPRSRMVMAVIVASLLAFATCRADQKPKPPKPPLILVFADVTDSLRGDELTSVHSAIYDIFDRAPEKATVVVYPVAPVMAYVAKLSRVDIPLRSDDSATTWKKHADVRARHAKETVEKLVTAGRALQPSVPSSCLTAALLRAADDIAGVKDRPVDIVFISDMVEECDRSIGGRRVMLNSPRVDADIAAAKSLDNPYADLRGADVYFIYPAGSISGHEIGRRRAHPEQLKAFWRAVLSHCNVNRTSFFADASMFHTEWKSARAVASDVQKR